MFDTLLAIGMGLGAAVALAELGSFFFAPQLLGRLAFLRAAPERRVSMTPEQLDRLTVDVPHLGGYRESAARRLDLGRAAGEPKTTGEDRVSTYDLGRGLATARLRVRFIGMNRVLALALVRVQPVDGGVLLTARFLPVPFVSIALLAVLVPALIATEPGMDPGTAIGMGAFVVCLNLGLGILFARGRIRDAVKLTMDEIEERLHGR